MTNKNERTQWWNLTYISSVGSVTQSFSDSVTPWTAACQSSLSITNFQSLLKLMSIESVVPSNHLVLCCPLLLPPSTFPRMRVFPMSQFFASGGQSIGVSASILPMNSQEWFPLGWTGWISLQYKELSRVSPTSQFNASKKYQFFGAQLSSATLTSIHDYWKNHSFD